MLRSLYSGVSGMQNHQTRMDVIGNNIANVNTLGFKYGRVNFSDQVSQLDEAAAAPTGNVGGTNPKQVGLGMQTASIDTVMTQGNLETTGKATDVAIQGSGYFVVSNGLNNYYTRAGNFDFDRQGTLVQPANGYRVMGWPATTQPGASSPTISNQVPIAPINIPAGAVIPPKGTTILDMTGNLDQRTATVAPNNTFTTSVNAFDSLGNQHFVSVVFTHSTPPGSNWTWALQDTNEPAGTTVAIANNPGNPPQALQFDSSGILTGGPSGAPYVGGAVDVTWTLPDGTVTKSTITPNFGKYGQASGMTQFADSNTAVVADQDGYAQGQLTGVTVDSSGVINGVFSNGRQQLLGQMALATFTNPGALMKEGSNNFLNTNNSGSPIIRQPGQAEAGTITAGALEMSNVDLAQQFADMIVTERGFQANSRVITTSDQLLQELLNLVHP